MASDTDYTSEMPIKVTGKAWLSRHTPLAWRSGAGAARLRTAGHGARSLLRWAEAAASPFAIVFVLAVGVALPLGISYLIA